MSRPPPRPRLEKPASPLLDQVQSRRPAISSSDRQPRTVLSLLGLVSWTTYSHGISSRPSPPACEARKS
ncbi:MAG: hypothetical protein ACLQLG_08855 [Thermoguttaceae bacterium]